MNLNRKIQVDIDATGAKSGARTATEALREVDAQARKTGGGLNALEAGGGNAAASLRSLGGAAKLLGPIFAGVSATAFAKSVLDTGVALDSLTRSFTAVFGSGEAAGAEFDYIRAEAARLGQSFYDLAPQFKQIAAAARETALEGEPVHKVFSAITEASTALGLSADQTGGALNALSQMISKGNVQAEELRGQLGERLPGAVQIAARAMNVSTQELNKMLEQGEVLASDLLPKLAEELHRMYGAAAETSGMESAQSAINRLSEAWKDLLGALYNADLATDSINAFAEALRITKTVVETVLKPFGDFYRIIDNIDGALERIGQGRMNWSDFAGMNGAELKDALAGTRENLEKEMKTLQEKIAYQERIASNALLGSISSGAKAKADAYRATYSELEKQLLGYEEKELAAANEILTRNRTVAEEKAKISKAEKDRLQKLLDDELLSDRQKLDRQLEQMRAAGFAAVEIEQFKARRIAEINEKAAQAAETAARKAEAAKEKALKDAQERNALKPYQVTALEQMNAGDMFFGKAAADKRGLDLLNDVYERNDELLTEFADKHREVVQGETAFKLEQIDLQAQAYRRAGADEVAVEQWAKAEKKKIATDWQTGVLRGLEEVAIGNQNAAQTMEDAITGAFGSMTDAIVDFAMTGKASFSDFADSVVRDMMRMMVQQSITGPLAGAAGDFLSGMFSGSSTSSVAPSGASGLYYSVGHAKGGWYENSPSLSAYSNGVYDTPHFFAFAQGGVFGEAGAEAIMPLKRGADGSLGVRASAGAVNIVVNNHAPNTKATATSRDDGRGGKSIEVIIDEIGGKNLARHGSASDRALRSRYNLSPALTGR